MDYIISFSTGPFCLGKDVDGASKSLLTGFEDDGAWLDPRFPIGGAKMYKKCWSECTFLDEKCMFCAVSNIIKRNLKPYNG